MVLLKKSYPTFVWEVKSTTGSSGPEQVASIFYIYGILFESHFL